MSVKKLELKINPLIEKAIHPLSEEDYQALKESIREMGLRHPIEVMEDGTVVDGHHRLKICQELGIEPKYEVLDFIKTVEDAIKYTSIINTARRNSNIFQKAKTGYGLLQIEREKAKQRMQAGRPSTEISLGSEKGKAIEIVARRIGLSRYKFEQCVEIIEHAPKKIQDLVEQEKLSIKTAYELTVALENEDVAPPKEIKEEFWQRVIDAENPEEEAKKVVKIVMDTNAVKEIIEMEDEEIAKKIKETWEDKFYTEQLDVDEVRDNINVWSGGTGKLVKVYLPYEMFQDEENPEEAVARYFARYGGRYLDKITATVFVGEVNKYLWRKRKEESEKKKKETQTSIEDYYD